MRARITISVLAGAALLMALETTPAAARPGVVRPVTLTPGAPATPRPSSSIAAQNNGNLAAKTFRGTTQATTKSVTNLKVSTKVSTDIN